MFDMKNTYWNNNGKYQEFIDGLTDRTPGHGYTCNVYANIYLAMTHLYYDAYNNGGGNIEDNYAKDFHIRVEPYLGDKVKLKAFLDVDSEKMEDMVNIALEFIKDKNLEFPIYSFWCNHEAKMISEHKPEGEIAEKGYWFELTFGEPEEMDKYKTSWCSKYQDVTVEGNFLESLAQNMALDETVHIWFDTLLKSVGKLSVEELTQKEILNEIEEVKGTIENEKIALGLPGSFAEENIERYNTYLEMLNVLCDKAKEKEGSLDDIIKDCAAQVKDMPGLKIIDNELEK